MALEHDATTGFLRGESVGDEVEQLAQELKLLLAIEANTSDIAKHMEALARGRPILQPEPAGARQAANFRAANDPAAPIRLVTGTGETDSSRLSLAQQTTSERPPVAATPEPSTTRPVTSVAPVAPTAPTPTPAGPSVPAQPATAPATPTPAQPAPAPAPATPTATPKPAKAAPISPAQPGQRDSSGRFVSKGSRSEGTKSAEGHSSTAGDGSEGLAKKLGRSIADATRDSVGKLTADVDNVDPTIQAAKELSGLMSPVTALFKPLGRLFGRNKDTQQAKEHKENVTWLRRIWRGQADANKGKGGGAGGLLGMLLGLVSAILAPFKALGRVLGLGSALKAASSLLPGRAGRVARAARASESARAGRASKRTALDANGVPIADSGKKATKAAGTASAKGAPIVDANGKRVASGTAERGTATPPGAKNAKGAETPGSSSTRPTSETARGAKTGGIRGAAKSVGGGALKMGKGLLSKIPLIGALFGGAMLASDVMAADDPELSKEENKKNKWSNVGGGIGGLVGGALGLFGGPAGAIAGSMLGDSLGAAVGEWLSTVNFDKVTSAITDTFSGLSDTAGKAADVAFGFMKDGWDKLVTTGTSAITSMADWARDTWKAVTDKVAGWKDNVADKVQTAKDYVGGKVDTVKDTGANLLYRASAGKYGSDGSQAAKDQLIKAMDAGGITDQQSKAALMANVDHESGGFTKKEENLNYSAKRLREVFPKYYKTDEEARADAGNPEAIGNKVYGGRMGNTDAGDGYKYRGRGALQLTGKAQYAEMSKKLGVDLVNNPELAADPKYSAQIAVQHWKSSGADKAAQAGDITQARKLTNGGTNGLADVNSKYDAYLAQAKAGDLTPARRADELKVAAPASVNAAVASTMASVASPKALAGAQAVTPIGVLAPTQAGVVANKPALAPTLATAQGVTPIGIMAPTQVRAAAPAPASTSIPATLAAPRISSYAPAAPDASLVKAPAIAEVKTPQGGGGKDAPPTVNVELPLSQDVGDRGIAHVSTGGMALPRY